MKRKGFSPSIRNKVLLWSARHCCLCGKACGTNIEVAHLEKGKNGIDNAIPLCFDCHTDIGRYDPYHPKGSKYRTEELKARRNQIYEQYTRDLVPPLLPQVLIHPYGLPRVGFRFSNFGNFPYVKAKVKVRAFLGTKEIPVTGDRHGYYSGEMLWHLNPRIVIDGNFGLHEECVASPETLRVQVDVTIFDIYERPHKLLPSCFTYVRESKDQNGKVSPPFWFLEPTSFENLRNRTKRGRHALQ